MGRSKESVASFINILQTLGSKLIIRVYGSNRVNPVFHRKKVCIGVPSKLFNLPYIVCSVPSVNHILWYSPSIHNSVPKGAEGMAHRAWSKAHGAERRAHGA